MRTAPAALCNLAAAWRQLSQRLFQLFPAAGPLSAAAQSGEGAKVLPLPLGLLFRLSSAEQLSLLDKICNDNLPPGQIEELWRLASAVNALADGAADGWPLEGAELVPESTADEDGGTSSPVKEKKDQQKKKRGAKDSSKKAKKAKGEDDTSALVGADVSDEV